MGRRPPAGSPRDTASAGSETDKPRAQKPVAEARSETQESKTVTWPMTNEPRPDGLQLAHEREQRRRSETLNPRANTRPQKGGMHGGTRKRQSNMRQMAEHLRLKPGSQKTPTVAHDRRHGRTQLATTAATAAPDSEPKTAPARQKRGAAGHRSRAQRTAQTTPPTGKSSPRRATRRPPTLTERPKRPPAPTGANRPTKPRKAQRAWKRPRISRTQGVVGSKPLGDGGLQAPKIPENPVDFR